MNAISGHQFALALYKRGLIPQNTLDASLHFEPDGLVHFKLSVAVELEDLPKIQEALQEITDDANRRAAEAAIRFAERCATRQPGDPLPS